MRVKPSVFFVAQNLSMFGDTLHHWLHVLNAGQNFTCSILYQSVWSGKNCMEAGCRHLVRTSCTLSCISLIGRKLVWRLQTSGQNFTCSILHRPVCSGKKLVWTLQVSGQNFACSMLYQSDLIGKNLYGSCRHLVRTSHALCCISLF